MDSLENRDRAEETQVDSLCVDKSSICGEQSDDERVSPRVKRKTIDNETCEKDPDKGDASVKDVYDKQVSVKELIEYEELDEENHEVDELENLINKELLDFEERKHECGVCNKRFKQKCNLNAHMVIHTEEKPFSCLTCGKGFNLNGNLKMHIKRVHTNDRPHKCSVCGKGFIGNFNLMMHMRTHSGEKPFSCAICGKSFAINANLKCHMRIHSGESPYKCLECGRAFKDSSSLKVHSRLHTGERPYKCTVCSKELLKNGDLKKHMRVHTREKPYTCSECGKSFSEAGTLKTHVLIHTGERPHVCPICHQGFTRHVYLRTHYKVHSGDKPYSCKVCMKQFRENFMLRSHMQIHSGEKPFECNICKKRFLKKSNCIRHTKTHVGQEEQAMSIDDVAKRNLLKVGDEEPKAGDEDEDDIVQILPEDREVLIKEDKVDVILVEGDGDVLRSEICIKEKMEISNICKKRFLEKSNCIRHTKTHVGQEKQAMSIDDVAKRNLLKVGDVEPKAGDEDEDDIVQILPEDREVLIKEDKVDVILVEGDGDVLRSEICMKEEMEISNICRKRFLKKDNCIRHTKTHVGQEEQAMPIDDVAKRNLLKVGDEEPKAWDEDEDREVLIKEDKVDVILVEGDGDVLRSEIGIKEEMETRVKEEMETRIKEEEMEISIKEEEME